MAIKFNPGEILPPIIEPTTTIGFNFTDSKEYDLDEIIDTKLRNSSTSELIMRVNTKEEISKKVISRVIEIILNTYSTATKVEEIPGFYIALDGMAKSVFDTVFEREFKKLTDQEKLSMIEGSLTLDDSFKSRVLSEDISAYLTAPPLEGYQTISWVNISVDETSEDDLLDANTTRNKITSLEERIAALELLAS